MPERHAWVSAGVGLVLAAVGAGAWWAQPADPTSAPASTGSGTHGPGDSLPSTGTTATPVLAPSTPGAPTRISIPALRMSARVLPVHAPGRTLVPPSDPTELGWWADGAEPGAARGSALVAGHTVHTGGGALDDLEEVRPGESIVVRTGRSVLRYVVRRVRSYDKGRIAADAARLFSQDVPGRLVVVTCEDWDGARYLSNVVVTATPR